MALQRMILVPPEMWEKRSKTPPLSPVKKILNSKDHCYNEWTKALFLKPILKKRKTITGPIPIPIVESEVTHPSFKQNQNLTYYRVVASV